MKRSTSKGTHVRIQPKKFEFSKLVIVLLFLACIQITGYGEWMMYLSYKVAMTSEMKTMDLTPLAYIIPGWIGILATGVSFYLTKSKAENTIKLEAIYSNGTSETVEPTTNI